MTSNPISNTFDGCLPLGMTVLYQDFQSGLRAKRFSDSLQAALPYDRVIQPLFWRLELIEFPSLAREITAGTANDELLILATRSQSSITVNIMRWLEAWVESRSNSSAILVALIEDGPALGSRAFSLRQYLRQMTKSRGVAFFSHSVLPPEGRSESVFNSRGGRETSWAPSRALGPFRRIYRSIAA